MTQPPANILLRIEQLLSSGKLQEARVLLVDFIQFNPNSSRAWWLLSMTLMDVDRQVACLKRVLRLDPENKLAQTRLTRLNNQVTPPTETSPFTSSIMGETEEIADDISIIPDWAKPAATPAVSKPLPTTTPEPESNAVLPGPNPVEEPAFVPPADLEPEEPQVKPIASAGLEDTPPIPAQRETASTSKEQLEPEDISTPSTQQDESLAVSPLSSDVEGQEASQEPPPSPGEKEVSSRITPGQIEPKTIPAEPVPPVLPEASLPTQAIIDEAEAFSSLPPEPVEFENVSGEPTVTTVPEPEIPEPVSIIEEEESAFETPSPAEPEKIPSEPSLASRMEGFTEKPPAPVEQPGISAKPALVAEIDEPFTTLPIPDALESVFPVPPAVIAAEVVSAALAPASEKVESSTKPSAYVEPNTASTKRALFSELDKSFNKPPVSLEPAASPSLPLQSVEIRAPSINQAYSRAVTAPPKPPTPIKPSAKPSRPRNPASRWEIVYILIAAFIILATVAVIGYIAIQRRGQAQAPAIADAINLQQTLVVAQTLTSLPLPTLIPTWTLSPTWTGVPTATFTSSPSPSPTQVPTATKTPRPTSQVGPLAGLFAPDFTLTELASGKQVTLSLYDGQPVLIYFWATWCNNCNIEMGSIESISQANKAAGLVTLTVNAAEDLSTVTLYRSNHNLTVPILLDPDSVFKNAYNVNLDTIPVHFFIDTSGRIKSIRMGQMTQAELQGQVDAILPLSPTPTP